MKYLLWEVYIQEKKIKNKVCIKKNGMNYNNLIVLMDINICEK